MTLPDSQPSESDTPAVTKRQSAKEASLGNAVIGTAIAGGLGFLCFRLLQSVLGNLPPVNLDGPPIARTLSIGIRYLLVGTVGLLTFTFGIVAVGLVAYTGQLIGQKIRGQQQQKPSSPDG
jgi:hypothetical protein